MIAPVIKQSLPNFTLVYGFERSLEIAEKLMASTFIPLGDGDLETAGPLSGLVQATGSIEGCEQMIQGKLRLERPTPGVPLTVN